MSELYALLIVGGGPAGLAAARAYREVTADGRVAIITDEHLLPYNRPPLTKDLLRGESSPADLPIESEDWFDEQHVELIGGRAVALDAESRTLILSGGRLLRYDHCLLATGSEPSRPPVPGADHARVTVMRTLDDLRRLEQRLESGVAVVVIGSGFIACEIAASLRVRGHAVDLVSGDAAPNAARLGPEAADRIAGWLIDAGVHLHMNARVEAIEHGPGRCTVTAGDERVNAGVVVMGTGVTPRGELAGYAGIFLSDGAIPVDAAMRTAQAGVLAAGDVALAENLAAGRRLRVEHWGDALGQGAVAGQTAAGVSAGWNAVPGFWSTIGEHTLKYTAWGDGFDDLAFNADADGAFTVRYGRAGVLVGVLTHRSDDEYDRAAAEIAEATPWR